MKGKSFSLPVGAIRDFCENAFRSFFCFKLGFSGNVQIIPVFTPIDTIWH